MYKSKIVKLSNKEITDRVGDNSIKKLLKTNPKEALKVAKIVFRNY